LYTKVHSSVICNSLKVEIIQISIRWWMDHQNIVYSENEILFRYKKEWSADTYYNVDETWKYNAKEPKHKRPNIRWFPFYERPKVSQFTKTES
jgi:hypothetical protein